MKCSLFNNLQDTHTPRELNHNYTQQDFILYQVGSFSETKDSALAEDILTQAERLLNASSSDVDILAYIRAVDTLAKDGFDYLSRPFPSVDLEDNLALKIEGILTLVGRLYSDENQKHVVEGLLKTVLDEAEKLNPKECKKALYNTAMAYIKLDDPIGAMNALSIGNWKEIDEEKAEILCAVAICRAKKGCVDFALHLLKPLLDKFKTRTVLQEIMNIAISKGDARAVEEISNLLWKPAIATTSETREYIENLKKRKVTIPKEDPLTAMFSRDLYLQKEQHSAQALLDEQMFSFKPSLHTDVDSLISSARQILHLKSEIETIHMMRDRSTFPK